MSDANCGRPLTPVALLPMGAFSPFAGKIADRFGTARTVAVAGILYVIGIFMVASANEGVMLILGNVFVRHRHGGRRVRADFRVPSPGRHRPTGARSRLVSRSPADPPPANTPYWLLWSIGIIALMLSIVAFMLWGLNGPGTLFDMIVT